jgi:hypothetical protein
MSFSGKKSFGERESKVKIFILKRHNLLPFEKIIITLERLVCKREMKFIGFVFECNTEREM